MNNLIYKSFKNGSLNYLEFCQSIDFGSFNLPPLNIPRFATE